MTAEIRPPDDASAIKLKQMFKHCTFCKVIIIDNMHVLLPFENTKTVGNVYKGDYMYFPSCLKCLDRYLEESEIKDDHGSD